MPPAAPMSEQVTTLATIGWVLFIAFVNALAAWQIVLGFLDNPWWLLIGIPAAAITLGYSRQIVRELL